MRKQILLCFLLFLAAALLGGCQKKRLKDGVLIESFSYETVGTAMGSETALSIVRDDGGFTVTQSSGGGRTVRRAYVGQTAVAQATDILRAHNALSWDGFAKSDPHMLDGTSFSLYRFFRWHNHFRAGNKQLSQGAVCRRAGNQGFV